MSTETLASSLAAGVVPAPDAVAVDARYNDVTLPSGRRAQVLKHGTGKHLVLAERLAPEGTRTGTAPWQMAMVAVKCRIEGNDLTYEQVLEQNDLDLLVLVAHVLGNGSSVSNT
jgi:hypothetical protein